MFFTAAVVTAGIGAVYFFRKTVASLFDKDLNLVGTKGSAFARVAEQEGKLIALKTTTAVKLEAAKAAHAALDEIDSLLG